MTLIRRLLMYLLVSLMLVSNLGFLSFALAETLKTYQVEVNQSTAMLSLVFNSAPKYSSKHTNQGLVLKFSGALQSVEWAKAQKKLSPWVSSLWSSYDSILVKPRPGVTINTQTSSNTIHMSFHSEKVTKTSEVKTNIKSLIAVERAKAILDMESGRPFRAREKLLELQQELPSDTQIMLDLARVEEKINHWRAALKLCDQALALNPKSTSIYNMRSRLLREHGSRVSLGAQYWEIGENSRQLVLNTLNAQHLTKDSDVVSVNYNRINAVEDEGILRLDGSFRPYDINRYRLAIALASPLKLGEQRFSVFSGAKELGVGWAYSRASNLGLTALSLEWKRPWFQTPEAVIGYGHRDKIALKHGTSVGKHISLYGDISLNQYGLRNFNDAAKSRRLQLGGRYKFQPTREGFSLGYGVDWEDVYELGTKTLDSSTDSNTNTYTPLPLETREQHVVDVGWFKNLRRDLVLDAQLGFQYDNQRDANAPFARIFLSANPRKNFEWKMSLESGLSTYRERDEDFLRVAGLMSWYF